MSLAGFSLWDIFFFILALYFVTRGLFRGFVGEVIALVGFFASFYFSFNYSGAFGRVIERLSGVNGYVAQAVAGVVIWLAIAMLASVVRMIAKSILRAVSLGGIDKLLGLFSGVLKTVVAIYAIMTVGILLAPVANPTWMSDSDVLRYAGRGWPQFRSVLVGLGLVDDESALPDGTLEQILRPYREGGEWPDGYNYNGGESEQLLPAEEEPLTPEVDASGV